MNKPRRKAIASIMEKMEELYSELESVQGEEQEALDSIPENLIGSERYEAMETAISTLEDALSYLEQAKDSLEEILS